MSKTLLFISRYCSHGWRFCSAGHGVPWKPCKSADRASMWALSRFLMKEDRIAAEAAGSSPFLKNLNALASVLGLQPATSSGRANPQG